MLTINPFPHSLHLADLCFRMSSHLQWGPFPCLQIKFVLVNLTYIPSSCTFGTSKLNQVIYKTCFSSLKSPSSKNCSCNNYTRIYFQDLFNGYDRLNACLLSIRIYNGHNGGQLLHASCDGEDSTYRELLSTHMTNLNSRNFLLWNFFHVREFQL